MKEMKGKERLMVSNTTHHDKFDWKGVDSKVLCFNFEGLRRHVYRIIEEFLITPSHNKTRLTASGLSAHHAFAH